MDELIQHPAIRVKRKNVRLIQKYSDIINQLFFVRFSNNLKKDEGDSNYVLLRLEFEKPVKERESEIAEKVQSYVDSLCSQEKDQDESSVGGEDSSYDSDFEVEESKSHKDVSRTVSDTLAAEFAEYVSVSGLDSSCYTAKVEFGLKLGYTEKLVQAALCKLGPNPSQNELLAELIRLGAQSSKFPDFENEGLVEEASIDDGLGTLRPIVIDGSNVAMSHGNKEVFSCKGIKICVDWFKSRGHKEITVFVPKWRKEASRPDNPITDQEILTELEKERIVVFTPSRFVGGKRTICYDDRYVLRLAVELDGIVVSNDNYRDLAQESSEFRKVVEERTLMYSFVNDRFMPPDDPLGRSGPTLNNFLRVQPKKGDPAPPCPYGKKCTYGNKCKYHHPERGSMPHKSVTERLVEHAQKQWQARGLRDSAANQLKGKSLSVPLSGDDASKHHGAVRKTPLSRTKSGAPGNFSPFYNAESDWLNKSKSVENILNERSPAQVSQSQHICWRPMNAPDWQFSQMMNQGASHTVVGQRLSDPESSPIERSQNLHKKLERQLTLNPYDPRVYEAGRRYFGQFHLERPYWEHQNVTRIASAPDSYRPEPSQPSQPTHVHRLSSTSDPQINLCVPDHTSIPESFESRPWMAPQPQVIYAPGPVTLPPPPPHPLSHFDSYSKEEARRKLHYHLASIFPEEQVRAALQLYPDETKPQEICAAILAMFPKV